MKRRHEYLTSPLRGEVHRNATPRRSFLSLAAAAAALATPSAARAQLNVTRPIRIIVPFAPAGSSDVLARLLQSPLQQALGQAEFFEAVKGQRPKTERELQEWFASFEGKAATLFKLTSLSRWGNRARS